ncbi:hypothetical protein ACS0TY_017481 [Phlomoides rotata]
MNSDCFNRLCYLLKNLGGLRSTRNVSINEQVAIFPTILSHHTKNRVVKHTFRRSGYTISKHFNNVLNTLLKLYPILLVKPIPVPEDSTDNRWRYFKVLMDGGTNMNLGGRVRKRVVPTSRRVWTYAEELELVGALKDLNVKGQKCDNSFKSGYLLLLENALSVKFPGTDLKGDPHINSKIHVDPTARGMKNKTFPFHQDWIDIFRNDRANGNDSQFYSDAVNDVNKQAAKKHNSSSGFEQAGETPMQTEFMTSEFTSFNQGDSSSATKDKGKVLKIKQIDSLALQFIDTMGTIKVAEYLCNNSKDMELFYSLPDDAKKIRHDARPALLHDVRCALGSFKDGDQANTRMDISFVGLSNWTLLLVVLDSVLIDVRRVMRYVGTRVELNNFLILYVIFSSIHIVFITVDFNYISMHRYRYMLWSNNWWASKYNFEMLPAWITVNFIRMCK